MQHKPYSWFLIIVMFFIFFPVAFWMIYKNKNTVSPYGGKIFIFRFIGWFLIIFGGLATFTNIISLVSSNDIAADFFSLTIMAVLTIGGGRLLLKKSKNLKLIENLYDRYYQQVISGNTLIDNIAANVPASYEDAVADLQKMVALGYFPGAHVDVISRSIISQGNMFRNNQYAQANYAYATPAAASAAPAQNPIQTSNASRTITCPGCGAINKNVAHANSECEYCGTAL